MGTIEAKQWAGNLNGVPLAREAVARRSSRALQMREKPPESMANNKHAEDRRTSTGDIRRPKTAVNPRQY